MKHPLILFLTILLYTVLPKTVLADSCVTSFHPSPNTDTILEKVAKKEPISTTDVNNLRIKRLADQYFLLSKEEAFMFVRSAEQMGFSVENVISMLKNKNFMEDFLLSFFEPVETEIKDFLKNSGQDLSIFDEVDKPDYRLYALHSILKLSNNQIMELVGINIKNDNYRKLLDISKLLETQQILENLGFSKEEIFDFIVKDIEGQQRTPFQISPEALNRATILFSEMGLDHSTIRQILKASVLELWASKQPKPTLFWMDNLEQYKALTVEEKKAILREHGLSDEVINRIPQDMFTVNIRRKLGELSAISASFALWGGFFYWLFFY